MADSHDYATRSLLQYIIFALFLLISISPFLLMLWKNATYREQLRDTLCCKHCTSSCARRVRYDEADLRMLRELEQPPQRQGMGITGAYRMYQARRSRLSLRLTSWREDVKRGGGDDDHLHHKLAQIRVAQKQRQQSQQPTATTSRASTNRANWTPNVPFEIRVVEINDRVDESNRSSMAMLSNSSDFWNDSDDGSVYELVASTPKDESPDRTGRRSVGIVEEEEEEKEDATTRDHEIV